MNIRLLTACAAVLVSGLLGAVARRRGALARWEGVAVRAAAVTGGSRHRGWQEAPKRAL